jgi:hypothetical protein
MGTRGVHFSRRLAYDQKAAVIAHASDITPRLRRRALTSMFISLETRHLVWDSNNLFFFFYFSVGWPSFFFPTKQLQKKMTPNFADRFDQCGRPIIGEIHKKTNFSKSLKKCDFFGWIVPIPPG